MLAVLASLVTQRAAVRRTPASPCMQMVDGFKDVPKVSSQLLFQDSKKAMTERANKERDMLEPNTSEMHPPKGKAKRVGKAAAVGGGGFGGAGSSKKGKKGKGAAAAAGGGGFGKNAVPVKRSTAGPADLLRLQTVDEEGVCLVPGVMGHEMAATLRETVADELSRAYASVEDHPETSVARFNVPVTTFDKLRGYLLLPLRDEASVEAGVADGPTVRALRELLKPGSPLGELFEATCDGAENAELYDLVALRTEAGAARQPIHSDTPWQKVPGLFCAFIAVHDVQYEMGTTVFLPGTHKRTPQRKAFDDGQFDLSRRDAMLSSYPSKYSLLKAGDAVFFNMNTLHAGTANFAAEAGGRQRLLFVLTFRNPKAMQELVHAPNLRPAYRNRRITLADMRRELESDAPFAGIHAGDGRPFGDGLPAPQGQAQQAREAASAPA